MWTRITIVNERIFLQFLEKRLIWIFSTKSKEKLAEQNGNVKYLPCCSFVVYAAIQIACMQCFYLKISERKITGPGWVRKQYRFFKRNTCYLKTIGASRITHKIRNLVFYIDDYNGFRRVIDFTSRKRLHIISEVYVMSMLFPAKMCIWEPQFSYPV